jgi:hypothetical protein
MNKNIKISGLCIAIAIVGLSLGNALTGHGIKGNKNLNPAVFADGSSGSGSGTGEGTGTDEGTGTKYTRDLKVESSDTGTPYTDGDQTCYTFHVVTKVTCTPGGSVDCIPGTIVSDGVNCFTLASN